MAFNLEKAPSQLVEATIAPPKSEVLYSKMNGAIRVALAALDAGGTFALDALLPDGVGGAAANTVFSQGSQELHSRLLAKAITNAIIEYLREEVTTELSIQVTEETPGPVIHPHVIKIQPIKLVVP